jgi:hypothetical protein
MDATTLQTTRSSTRDGVAGVLAAVAAASAIWTLATAAGTELTVRFGDGQPIEITVISVMASALLTSLAGWGLLVALCRFTAKARTIWTATAAAAALLSLIAPLSTTAPTATKATLVAMHLAVAIALITALRPTALSHSSRLRTQA